MKRKKCGSRRMAMAVSVAVSGCAFTGQFSGTVQLSATPQLRGTPRLRWTPSLNTARGDVVKPSEVTLVAQGVGQSAIYVAREVMEPGQPARELLRESVRDLAHYLEKISGTRIEVITGPPKPADDRIRILIGDVAVESFGPPGERSPYKQGWRMVVSPTDIGLMGESDEATSYAIYELLDRLGCRWYMPSEMGEVIPSRQTIMLPLMDVSEVPRTLSRNIWYSDAAFRRRNRLGGLSIATAHALEVHAGDRYGYLTRQQLEANPDWNAMIGGKRSINGRFCWGNPEVSAAVAESIIRILDKQYSSTISLSPEDGANFCECDKCKALDAGDWDPTMNQISITDRYVNFCNRIAERVTRQYPEVLFGYLAYVQYTRPPVRETPHASLVPMIAPITYCRAHSMLDSRCPSRQALCPIVEGWGKKAHRIIYRNYMFNLAELSVPYPMMKQMSDELPVLYTSKVAFWQPETMPNFESVLPGLYLTIRKSWYTDAAPQPILDEFFSRFYEEAAEPMRRYWRIFDDAWTQVPEHAGSGFGYLRRFQPSMLQSARQALGEALTASRTPVVKQRVQMQEEALAQFELFMKLRRDLHEGRLETLEADSQKWVMNQRTLAERYSPQYAFGKMSSTQNYSIMYFERFFQTSYADGARIARDFTVLSPSLSRWRYQVDGDKKGEALGWYRPDFDDEAWQMTDPIADSWASLGLMDYFGPVWYRQTVQIPQVHVGKKVYLWVSSEDGSIKVYVNGHHVPYVNSKGEASNEFSGYATPVSFDVTAAIKPLSKNQITIVGSRIPPTPNELGTGGLLGPVLLYHEK